MGDEAELITTVGDLGYAVLFLPLSYLACFHWPFRFDLGEVFSFSHQYIRPLHRLLVCLTAMGGFDR